MRERALPQPQLRCAYCHDALAGQPSSACDGCGTWLHVGCLAEVAACPLLGCGVNLGSAPKGTPTDTELYTRALDDAIGPPLRWSMRISLAICMGVGLLGALAAATPMQALATLVLCAMTGSLIGMVVGGLIGGVRERRAFGEGWTDEG